MGATQAPRPSDWKALVLEKWRSRRERRDAHRDAEVIGLNSNNKR